MGPDKDPRYGIKYLKQLYEKAVPGWSGRSTVPVLWDTKKGQWRTRAPFYALERLAHQN
jgi:glutathionyl-hydroquinone reductase